MVEACSPYFVFSMNGTWIAKCTLAMRERTPRAGFSTILVLAVVIAAMYFALRNILLNVPR
jgi:hypothetical protein